jgi:hypothetical protein
MRGINHFHAEEIGGKWQYHRRSDFDVMIEVPIFREWKIDGNVHVENMSRNSSNAPSFCPYTEETRGSAPKHEIIFKYTPLNRSPMTSIVHVEDLHWPSICATRSRMTEAVQTAWNRPDSETFQNNLRAILGDAHTGPFDVRTSIEYGKPVQRVKHGKGPPAEEYLRLVFAFGRRRRRGPFPEDDDKSNDPTESTYAALVKATEAPSARDLVGVYD